MKKIQLGLVAVTTALLLTGCGEAKITGTPIKNVDSIAVTSAEDIDVFCPTGICTFELTLILVNFITKFWKLKFLLYSLFKKSDVSNMD